MRTCLLSFFCLLFSGFLLCAQEAIKTVPVPQYKERRVGYADLSQGIFLEESVDNPIPERMIRCLRAQEIPFAQGTPARRNVRLEWKEAAKIASVPEGVSNAYRLHVGTSRITLEYTSLRAAEIAVAVLGELYREYIPGNRRKRLPAYEIRGWEARNAETVFRIRNDPFLPAAKINEAIPISAGRVELMLTSPRGGWLLPGESLLRVNHVEPIHSDGFYSYADLNELPGQLGMNLVPVFDLGGPNPYFESSIGHPVLSVEGMRFVRRLLDDFFTNTTLSSVAFVVPAGRYREQIEQIVARYPHITDLRFLDQ